MEEVASFVARLGNWGYALLFAMTALESAAFFGIVMPGETLVLFAGFLAYRGVLDLEVLMVLFSAAAIAGDATGYTLGRRLGRGWLLRRGRRFGVSPARLARVDRFFARHGGKAVITARFVGFVRTFAPFAAGSSSMRFGRFLTYDAIGSIAWAVGSLLAGYLLGASWQVAEKVVGRASAILLGAAVVVALLVLAGRWTARNEATVRRLLDVRPVRAVRRATAPIADFLQARLTPAGYLGLHLTVGVAVLISATWLLSEIASGVAAGQRLTGVDGSVTAWLNSHAAPSLTAAMEVITMLGSPPVVVLLTLLASLLVTARRDWHGLLALVLVVPGGLAVSAGVHALVQFVAAEPHIRLDAQAFPSAFTVASALLYGVLAVLAARAATSWRISVFAIIAGVAVMMLVGFSRVYLGARALSDVLGGFAFGLAWLAACLTPLETLRRRYARAWHEEGGEVAEEAGP